MVKKGHVGSRDPILASWDRPNISPTAEARNFKFGMETDRSEFLQINAKLRQKGSCGGHVTHFWNFGTP